MWPLCSFLLITAARSRRRLLLAGSFVVLAAIATHIYLEANAANRLVACQQEYKSVQAGIDGLMANNSLSVVQPTGPKGTNDMRSPVLLFNSAGSPSSPTFVPFSTTQYFYVWDVSGRILKIRAGDGLAEPPQGCVVSGAPRAVFELAGTGIFRPTPGTDDMDLPVRFAFGWTPRTGPLVGALHETLNGHAWSWGFDQNTRNPYTPGNPQPIVGGSFSVSIDSITPGTPWTITIYYL
jgi:hypothetical protein